MAKGYVFISNSNKPGMSVPNPMNIDIDTFSHSAVYAADKLGYKIYMGYNVDHPENLKCRQYDITYFHSNIYRNIFAFRDNYKAYKILCNLLKKHPEIEVIHCNTPIGGVIGRIVGHKFKKKVIYTAHGFHFYKGAPLLNWLLYYPIEKFLARRTDVLIAINKEDYAVAKRLMKNKCAVYYVPGVGVDIIKFSACDEGCSNIRHELGIADNDILVVAVGRLDNNKNNATTIKAIAETENKTIHLAICGDGESKEPLLELTKILGIAERVHFLGNRSDIPQIFSKSDIFVLSSFREGLSRSIMEAMAAGLPCIVSDIRGNRDLIDDGKGGHLFHPNNCRQLAGQLDMLATSIHNRKNMGTYNQKKVEQFSIESSKEAFAEIFEKELNIG